ncbi:SemiSWEET transporter [Flavobacteriaceae bacterium]|jgi:MtN3 and saliva related transmembrane protein|nr:SemiSWEET transporter [bacterium]MDB4133714.1 SemiSWEET transporter [Flavobacteriaceae bacterium]MDB4180070.1 SemiSWEET transporter [Flavobacteriaceae bacterium]MDC0496804.1 SemiSWEET transporter [Flavobacteriaceae bacterium]MDC0623277.1 SemiSWEET transporter [Flavobacteriaceae bacterium]
MNIEIIGLIAAVFTTSSFFPQVIKIWKTKQTKDISTTMYIAMMIGTCFWLTYGILINSIAIIAANIISGLLVLFVLIFKLVNRNN